MGMNGPPPFFSSIALPSGLAPTFIAQWAKSKWPEKIALSMKNTRIAMAINVTATVTLKRNLYPKETR